MPGFADELHACSIDRAEPLQKVKELRRQLQSRQLIRPMTRLHCCNFSQYGMGLASMHQMRRTTRACLQRSGVQYNKSLRSQLLLLCLSHAWTCQARSVVAILQHQVPCMLPYLPICRGCTNEVTGRCRPNSSLTSILMGLPCSPSAGIWRSQKLFHQSCMKASHYRVDFCIVSTYS